MGARDRRRGGRAGDDAEAGELREIAASLRAARGTPLSPWRWKCGADPVAGTSERQG